MRDDQVINAIVEYVTNARISAERMMTEDPDNEEYYAGKADAYLNVQVTIMCVLKGEKRYEE